MFSFPDTMMRVFRDEQHQATFEENGYIILPFYSPDEISELEQLYWQLHPVSEKGFFPSTFSTDKVYRSKADKEIRRIANRAISHYCMNSKIVCGSFIVKSPGPDSGMCVHQDMSLVDESRFQGINIWVPLLDLTVKNGGLFAIPGSHRLIPTYRGSSIPEFFSPVMDELIDYLQPLLVKAGEAIFFDQSIIHFSPPNFSEQARIVTNIYFTHQDTNFRTYYWNKEQHGTNRLEGFEQQDTFMTDFDQFGENIRERPKIGNSIGLIEYDFPVIDSSFLQKRLLKTNARALIEEAKPSLPQVQQVDTDNIERESIFWKWVRTFFKYGKKNIQG